MTDAFSTTCDRVCALVQKMIGTGILTAASPPLVEHIADCATCRGALAMLAAQIAEIPTPPPVVDCAACHSDLAAYVDVEHAQGAKAAAQAYPHIWWHLWLCPSCAETYRLTCALLDATEADRLPPMPLAQQCKLPPADS